MKSKSGEDKQRFVKIGRPHGFSLIELLAVIAVIAVLAGVIIGVLGRTKKAAQSVQCVSNLRQIGMAVKSFIVDNHNTMVPATDKTIADSWTVWHTFLRPYIPLQYTEEGKLVRSLYCPVIDHSLSASSYYTGYTFNESFDFQKMGGQFDDTRCPITWDDEQITGNSSFFGGRPSAGAGGGSWYKFAFRHDGVCHVLMLDGHVESIEEIGNGKADNYPQFNWGAE